MPNLRVAVVQEMDLEEYLRSVVPAEVPALWPSEAVKAQAVAARTYAAFRFDHPRHRWPRAHVCNTVHCQVYNPGRIHHRTDEAIEATAGLVMVFEGEIIDAMFSANCGGRTADGGEPWLPSATCPAPGPQNGHGKGLCQWGAKVMAQNGARFDEILGHYYGPIDIEPLAE